MPREERVKEGRRRKDSKFVDSLTFMSSYQHLASSPAKPVFLPSTSRIPFH